LAPRLRTQGGQLSGVRIDLCVGRGESSRSGISAQIDSALARTAGSTFFASNQANTWALTSAGFGDCQAAVFVSGAGDWPCAGAMATDNATARHTIQELLTVWKGIWGS